MMDQLKSQFEPMLREKEEKMRAQYGECPHLTFENDKECREMANKYLERLTTNGAHSGVPALPGTSTTKPFSHLRATG